MSDDIELPNGPLSFVSALRLEQVEAERDALRAEVERLQDADVVPGALAQRFKDERNIARVRVEQLEQALREIARTWPNAKRSGRRPSLSAEEAQRRADAALHPDVSGHPPDPSSSGRLAKGAGRWLPPRPTT